MALGTEDWLTQLVQHMRAAEPGVAIGVVESISGHGRPNHEEVQQRASTTRYACPLSA